LPTSPENLFVKLPKLTLFPHTAWAIYVNALNSTACAVSADACPGGSLARSRRLGVGVGVGVVAWRLPATLLVLLAGSYALLAAPVAYVSSSVTPPTLPREFRGIWVASVKNLDWPSRPGLATAQQQAELVGLLEQAKALHLNAVLLQVRPACDALYA